MTSIDSSSPASAVSATAPIDIVINAGSGQDDSNRARALIEGVLRAAGRAHRVHFIDGSVSVDAAARAALEQAQRDGGIVVAVGGDGTINAVSQAVHAAGVPLGVIPQGTFNYFGRAHGLPPEPEAAMRAILDGRVEPVQVGLANGRVFLVNASVGLYPELLQDREAWKARFGRSRAVAFVAALTTLFAAHRQLRLAISHEQGDVDVRTLTLVAANNALQLERLGLPEAAQLERGRLAVITVEPVSTWHLLGLVLRGALGTLGNAEAVRRFSTRRLDIRPRHVLSSRRRIKIALDGEIAWTQMPLRIEVAERPLWLVKPTTTVDAGDGAHAGRADGDAATSGGFAPGLVPAT
jgi:diacylglycerol kinase family enzyme